MKTKEQKDHDRQTKQERKHKLEAKAKKKAKVKARHQKRKAILEAQRKAQKAQLHQESHSPAPAWVVFLKEESLKERAREP